MMGSRKAVNARNDIGSPKVSEWHWEPNNDIGTRISKTMRERIASNATLFFNSGEVVPFFQFGEVKHVIFSYMIELSAPCRCSAIRLIVNTLMCTLACGNKLALVEGRGGTSLDESRWYETARPPRGLNLRQK